jgi:hypothetical protein
VFFSSYYHIIENCISFWIQCCQIHDFSREFTNKIHTFSREFTWIPVKKCEFTNCHTFSRNLFFILLVWTANKLNIASHELFHKKSSSSYRKNRRFFAKKPMRGYFKLCLPSIPVKKKISWKSVKICEFTRIQSIEFTRIVREKSRIWQHCSTLVEEFAQSKKWF